MTLNEGDFLVKGTPSSPAPFLQLLSDLRARVRSLVFPDNVTSRWVQYKGCKQFEPELALQLPTTGYCITFELTSTIPEVPYREI